jgi:isoquinoline 1-oxidoreductase alpha subunit
MRTGEPLACASRKPDRQGRNARMVEFTLNGELIQTAAPSETPLLWVIRDELGLMGTKFGCGIGQCGACTIHLNGSPVRGCLTPVAAAAGSSVTTIEGLTHEHDAAAGGHPLQRAWIESSVPQCGYCQSGQIMSAAALLTRIPDPSDEEIDTAMSGNICRCGTYGRIRAAIHRAAQALREEAPSSGETALTKRDQESPRGISKEEVV